MSRSPWGLSLWRAAMNRVPLPTHVRHRAGARNRALLRHTPQVPESFVTAAHGLCSSAIQRPSWEICLHDIVLLGSFFPWQFENQTAQRIGLPWHLSHDRLKITQCLTLNLKHFMLRRFAPLARASEGSVPIIYSWNVSNSHREKKISGLLHIKASFSSTQMANCLGIPEAVQGRRERANQRKLL